MSTYVGRGDVLGAASAVGGAASGAAAGSAAGPWGAVVGGVVGLIGGLIGSGGQTDNERIVKVHYFYTLAAAGNVGAAQVMLGSPYDVSGHEKAYWESALEQLSRANPAVYAAAQAAGPMRFTGQGDSATNYPHEKAFVQNWAANYQPVLPSSSSSSSSSATDSGSSPYVAGGLAPSGSPTRQLVPMVTTAPYNWVPVLVGVSVVGSAAAFFLSRRRGR